MNHDGRGATHSVIGRRMLVATLISCAAMALAVPEARSTSAAATGSNPAESLWREYPLEQTATTAGGSAVPSAGSRRPAASRTSAAEPGGPTPSTAVLLAAATGAALVVIAMLVSEAAAALRRRSTTGAGLFDELEPGAVVAWPRTALPADRPAAHAPARLLPEATKDDAGAEATDAAEATPAIEATPAAPEAVPRPSATTAGPIPAAPAAMSDARDESPAAVERRPAAVPSPSADTGAVERHGAPVRTTAGRICWIRWLPRGRGSCFSAVTTDDDGVDHTVATSRRVEWHARTPPEQTVEAQAALRQLVKTLRDSGWRPMATDEDDNHPRWYARRFRYPDAPAETERSTVGDHGARAS